MNKKIVWMSIYTLMALSLILVACAPAVAPSTPTAPATPAAPSVPTTTTPVSPAAPAAEKPQQEAVAPASDVAKLTLTRLDGTRIEKAVEIPKYGGTLTFAVPSDSLFFDPALDRGPSSQPFLPYSVLIGGDATRGPAGTEETDWTQGNFMGKIGFYRSELAESWKIVDDQTIVFTIRPGARFAQNPNSEASRLVGGREVTADDVAYSFLRQWNSPQSYHFVNESANRIQGAKALDKYTFELKIIPNTHGAQLIQSAARVSIFPKEVVAKYGDLSKWQNSVGSGPFMLTDVVPDASRTYSRNGNYFEKDPWFPENQLPYLDRVNRLVIPDASTRQAALRTGKLDYLTGLGVVDSESFKRNAPQVLQKIQHNNPRTLTGRMDKPGLPWGPQDDANALKVRRALNMAINKQDIVKNLYGGQGAVFGWPWPDWPEFSGIYEPFETYSQEIQELFQYNPEKARQLLKEAGYPNGFRATVTVISSNVDFAAILKDYLSKVGVELVIDIKDVGVMNTMLREMTYPEMIIDINRMSQSPVRYHGARLPSIWNYAYFQTPVTKAAYDEANSYLGKDDAKVAQIWKSISKHYLEKASLVMLPEEYTFAAWWPWLKRWDGAVNIGSWHPDGALYWLWLDRDLKKKMGY